MAQNQKNERLEEMLFDCSLTLFGRPNLEVFSKADGFKSYLEKDSLIYSYSCKFLAQENIAVDIGFYTISNKYELKNKLRSLASQYSFGLSYRIHALKE
ncbi:MAG: hypothetical protein ACP5MV_02075 [Candidatus Parvarchaeum sp.]